jgi:hypothetical protein
VVADITLSGPLAQVGRTGILNDIADRLANQFVGEVERRLTTTAETGESGRTAANKEFNAGNAVVSGIAGRVQRLVAKPFVKSNK